MKRTSKRVLLGRSAIAAAITIALLHTSSAAARNEDDHDSRDREHRAAVQHVLLISFDGLHEQDVARCIASNSCPNLAILAKSGVTYSNAHTPGLSDSFPGLAALVTGGSPKSTGLFYDVSYDRTLYAPSDTGCSGTQGWNVVFDETTGIDAQNGGPLIHLDGGGAFNPQAIPNAKVDGVCKPVYPHNYVKTNTVFEVIKQRIPNSRTAWSDKHAWGYDWLNGPSGTGVDDLARTEINSIDPNSSPKSDYTDVYTHTEKFDDLHVQALINQINGKNSSGDASPGVPTIFGANFQTLSVAQKAVFSSGGGYLDGSFTPGPQVSNAIGYIDASLGRIVAELKQRNLYRSTAIIVTSKHGQSPANHSKLVKNGNTLGKLLQANSYLDPDGKYGQNATKSGNLNDGTGLAGTGFVQTDDTGLIWLRDQHQLTQVITTLKDNLSCNAPGICADSPRAYVLYGPRLAASFGDPREGRTPDIIVQPNPGVIYTSSTTKDEEHGGNAPDDNHLGLVMYVPGAQNGGQTVVDRVLTTQVAPTILKLLGVDAQNLNSVRLEGTQILPGFDRNKF
ncbi:alkaline phosphatase family protein [Caballeronia cordobensis]|uniref:alkaline phosphatase family protein n=1 Tax=Caballeronia cordobensis TaxID=1353886 RepID=UPI00045F0C56|nr:type I phosphodiesterase/nucleotide pyrophosphatase precursor [Burkholderia sp. RPE67]